VTASIALADVRGAVHRPRPMKRTTTKQATQKPKQLEPQQLAQITGGNEQAMMKKRNEMSM
jgi:hypothetical protein